MNKEIFVIGVGRNTIVYIDLLECCGYHVAGLYHYNDERNGELYFGHKIIGSSKELFNSDLTGKLFSISVGNNKIRSEIFSAIIKCGGNVPSVIHPSAVVSKYAQLETGVIVHANSVISPEVTVRSNSVISSNVMVAHGSVIGENCFIASNVVLGAYVQMHDYAFIGSGSTIISGKVSFIGINSIIGAGSVVTQSVQPNELVAGNPARKIQTY